MQNCDLSSFNWFRTKSAVVWSGSTLLDFPKTPKYIILCRSTWIVWRRLHDILIETVLDHIDINYFLFHKSPLSLKCFHKNTFMSTHLLFTSTTDLWLYLWELILQVNSEIWILLALKRFFPLPQMWQNWLVTGFSWYSQTCIKRPLKNVALVVC